METRSGGRLLKHRLDKTDEFEALVASAYEELRRDRALVTQAYSEEIRAAFHVIISVGVAVLIGVFLTSPLGKVFLHYRDYVELVAPCLFIILIFVSVRELTAFKMLRDARQSLKCSLTDCEREIEWISGKSGSVHDGRPSYVR